MSDHTLLGSMQINPWYMYTQELMSCPKGGGRLISTWYTNSMYNVIYMCWFIECLVVLVYGSTVDTLYNHLVTYIESSVYSIVYKCVPSYTQMHTHSHANVTMMLVYSQI